jgi:hypothetical protein
VTWADLGKTQCHLVITRRIIVGGGQVSRIAYEFSLANLFGQYGGTLLAWLLKTILQST